VIEEGRAPKVWANIVGLGLFRPGRAQISHVFYGNSGNSDSNGGMLWITGIPKTAGVVVNTSSPAEAPPNFLLGDDDIHPADLRRSASFS
jgi:hypothetical protein